MSWIERNIYPLLVPVGVLAAGYYLFVGGAGGKPSITINSSAYNVPPNTPVTISGTAATLPLQPIYIFVDNTLSTTVTADNYGNYSTQMVLPAGSHALFASDNALGK